MDIPKMYPQDDMTAALTIRKQLVEYKQKGWAEGLTYEPPHNPDGFANFFTIRGLTIQPYVAAPGFSIGNPAAYDANLHQIESYIQGLLASETAAVNGTIAQINEYKQRNWGLGVTASGQPDGFTTFFAARKLQVQAYRVEGSVSIGSPAAYQANINTLTQYLLTLKG
jgi:hypothetical protein